MAKKVHKLKNDIPETFKIICISSHQNDYRLSWALNEKLGIQLQQTQDHKAQVPKSNVYQKFTSYSADDEKLLLSFQLISNKSENGYLLKGMQNIDYIFKISGELENISITELVGRLKEIPIVNTAFELDKLTPQQVKKLSF